VFPAAANITSSFLFSRLQNRAGLNFFCKLMVDQGHETGFGCYIEFSGSSTAQVILAQEPNLNTTYVIAGTASAYVL
jgi:hypothetical protein